MMDSPARSVSSFPPSEPRTLIVMGVSGCGKTAVATELGARLGWVFAEGDKFHPSANVEKMRAGHPLDDDDRWPWLRAIATWIGEHEQAGAGAIVTCSALKRSYRDLLRAGHDSVWFVHLTVPVTVLADRLKHRQGHFMPASLLQSQLSTLEPLGADEPGSTVPGDVPPTDVVAEVLAMLPACSTGVAPPCATATPTPRGAVR